MSVQFVNREVAPVAPSDAPPVTKRVRHNGGAAPLPVTLISLDQPGRLRVGHLLTLLSITSTTLYQRMNAGSIPKPDGHDGRPYWRTETIKAYLAGVGA